MIDAISSLRATAPSQTSNPVAEAARPKELTVAQGTLDSSGSFAAHVDSALEIAVSEAINHLKVAESTSVSGVVGEVPAQRVVEAVMSGERALQTAIAVRNKVVEAYLEISRMQI